MSDHDDTKPEELVTVDTFKNVHEADIARLYLEQAGIRAALKNIQLHTKDSLQAPKAADIKLQVPAKDMAHANEILRKNRARFNIDYGYKQPDAISKPVGEDQPEKDDPTAR